jgi:HlyD family secretion protein
MTPHDIGETVTTGSPDQHPGPTVSPPPTDGGPAPRPAPAPPARPAHAAPPTRGHSRRGRRIAVVVVLAGLVGVASWYVLFGRPAPPHDVVVLSGRIEGDDSAIAAKTSGRVKEIRVREGDAVQAGQIIALLDDQQIRAREQQAEAAVAQAEAQVDLTRRQIAILREQLHQSELAVEQAKADAEGRVSEAEARLAAAEAQLAQAEATYEQAKWDREAFTKLRETGAVSAQEAKRAQTTEESQRAIVNANRRQVEAARGVLTAAQASLQNPAIRTSQVAAVQAQILQQEAQIASVQADAGRARASLDEARANRADLEVIAPFTGTVATRTAEPGEVVAAGTPIVTIVDLGQVYLRGFIPEGQIGRVKLGQPARVYLDSAPTTPIEAVVSRIDPQASFTPENTYFREDRVKQVVGVKLGLRGAVGYAKPGMPADGEILVEGTEWPAARKR